MTKNELDSRVLLLRNNIELAIQNACKTTLSTKEDCKKESLKVEKF